MAGSLLIASFRWDIPPSVLARRAEDYRRRLLDAVYQLAQVFAARIEAYAKAHARWTDRTGNARQGLTSRAFRTAAGVVIALWHTMSYGIWLEVAHAGKYAIILEALEQHYGPLMAALRQLVRRR
jgi:hypothetical protein